MHAVLLLCNKLPICWQDREEHVLWWQHARTSITHGPLMVAQVIESTGVVVTPYMEYPQLLGMLLHMLSEGSPLARMEVLKVLGIVGALDPHTHKVNQANIQGEGKLEREGVRPQRQPDPTGLGGGQATTLGNLCPPTAT